MKEKDEPRKLSGVAALYVDANFIYYSCTEEPQQTEADSQDHPEYCLRKCDHKGKLIQCVYLKNFIRGLGLDQQKDYIYVVCSAADSQVFKLDKNMNAVQRTCNEASEHLGTAYELLVTSKHVLVCSTHKNKICILDFNLKLCFYLDLSFDPLELSFDPLGITVLNGKYFFTAKGTIGAVEIDLKENMYRIMIWEGMKTNNSAEIFNKKSIFRGICTSNNYLIVTEMNEADGRLLCLQCKDNQLRCVTFKKGFSKHCNHNCDMKFRCSPVVVTYGNDANYYSQGYHGGKFHIVKATITQNNILKTKKIFDCSTL